MNKIKTGVVAAVGVLALAACGDESGDSGGSPSSPSFGDVYTQQSSGAVSVEDAKIFAKRACASLEQKPNDAMRALLPLAMEATADTSEAVSTDYQHALAVGLSQFCPEQIPRVQQLEGEVSGL